MKTLVIIQARMGSSRLPGKVLLPLGKSIVLDYVVSRCKLMKDVVDVIVATSTSSKDDLIVSWCKDQRVSFFRGSEHDVLTRYVDCAKKYEVDYVMRVTSDCPFVDYEMANEMIALMEKEKKDLVMVNSDKLPRGLAVELVSMDVLTTINEKGKEPYHREHVTYYGYEHKEEFKIVEYSPKRSLENPKLRITLDTYEDYEVCKAVADHFNGNKFVSAKDVVQFLTNNPDISRLNANIEQKAVK
ncbi:cytidylyltransferase domain-containing protein [Bacillus salitolerans]|uniref:Cytidylyltransferase domain-containing protein n=1 Tax=Bacillus salitolerans TaxID=1437434 RepID=A0ABW4LQK0_9BACI